MRNIRFRMVIRFPLVIFFDSLVCTYVQRFDTSLLSACFVFLDDLLLGARGTGFSRLEDIVGKIKAGTQVKTYPEKKANYVQTYLRT